MVLADSCFNLTHESFEKDFDQVLNNARTNSVHYLFSPSSKESEIETLLKYSETINNLYVGIGIHPHNASELKPKTFDRLKEYSKHPSVRAIGEIGLDYYRNFQSPSVQKKCFEMHLELALELKLPVFLHHRDSFHDFYPILKNYIDKIPQSIVHCFTGTERELKSFLELGLCIGVTGWICDPKRGKELRELIKYIPDNRLLVETDAPYLIPKNLDPKPKSNRNEPMYLKNILVDIAELRMQNVDSLAGTTTKNFTRLFNC
tara:strand:+ start:3328 stop:4110 length:783 start_codon:yes stop_codon:yes gene_type:complete